eukprot:TRINITY_DN41110_c0_g1_i2.p1 TRINITY_DN41110_c0_g1~~TRINITY_DN41110_c0_g1_i2.p1  ORF type:complete len:302 (-),score=48.92 TRINITY_DN41110_c0_g1_i2:323-1228(-)
MDRRGPVTRGAPPLYPVRQSRLRRTALRHLRRFIGAVALVSLLSCSWWRLSCFLQADVADRGATSEALAGRRQLLAYSAGATLLSVGSPAEAASGVKIAGLDGKEVVIKNGRPDSKVTHTLDNIKWEAEWPYTAADFNRLDRTNDAEFYEEARIVKHVDDRALEALTAYYADLFPKDRPFTALDYCSSWVSHYPQKPKPERFAVTGMNDDELRRNAQATDHSAKDLNVDPTLPYGDEEFDIVTNTVSVDYLTKPLQVFREVRRVLKPGGVATLSFSNRFFFSKVISMWGKADDTERVLLSD